MQTIFIFDSALLQKESSQSKVLKFIDFLQKINEKTYYFEWLLLVTKECSGAELNLFMNKLSSRKEQFTGKDFKLEHNRVVCLGKRETFVPFMENLGFSFKKKKRRGIPYCIAIKKNK